MYCNICCLCRQTLAGGPGTVLLDTGPVLPSRYRRLIVNNNNQDTRDLTLAASSPAILTDAVPMYTFSEIVVTQKGALAFIPPPVEVASKLLVAVVNITGARMLFCKVHNYFWGMHLQRGRCNFICCQGTAPDVFEWTVVLAWSSWAPCNLFSRL